MHGRATKRGHAASRMATTGTRRRLLLAGCIWTMVLVALLGFTAEPSTSTQFDAREGRGVFVVQPTAGHQLVAAAVEDVLPGRRAAALLAMVTAVLLAGGAAMVVADGDRQLSRTVLGWARAARRGPPALV